MFYLCTTMHFLSQLRYNPKTRRDELYYRVVYMLSCSYFAVNR